MEQPQQHQQQDQQQHQQQQHQQQHQHQQQQAAAAAEVQAQRAALRAAIAADVGPGVSGVSSSFFCVFVFGRYYTMGIMLMCYIIYGVRLYKKLREFPHCVARSPSCKTNPPNSRSARKRRAPWRRPKRRKEPRS